ncbi:MAG TPA: tyrosine-type recombinase/integrase [Anaeromyxobacteraceae bacterium]|nr:tyrosine-type recombinase/integrase [Anaeromyxobacteraceae bacterium]
MRVLTANGGLSERATAGFRPVGAASPRGNVPALRLHDLRHTCPSVLLMLGSNLVSVQKLLGHSDPKITERRYGHPVTYFLIS